MASSLVKVAGLARHSKCILSSLVRKTTASKLVSPACFISTSKKNKDSISTVDPIQQPQSGNESPEEMFPADPKHEKNWISYGYDLVNKDDDRFYQNMTMFITVSLCLVGASFVLAYMPDHKLVDWSQREAYLEMARREREGEPLISCELLDPSQIELPSDEELGDLEIII